MESSNKPRIEIAYCPRCGWLLRAAWMAQELLSTFWEDVAAVSLVPAGESGRFEITVEGATIWSRAEMGGFPEIARLKRLARDRVAPGRDLGHLDRK